MNIGIIKNKGKIIIFEKIDMHKKKLEIKIDSIFCFVLSE